MLTQTELTHCVGAHENNRNLILSKEVNIYIHTYYVQNTVTTIPFFYYSYIR